MSKTATKTGTPTPSHTVRVSFMGEAGTEAFARLNGAKGFISHHASIATTGMNGGTPFKNPIQLSSYGSQADTLIPRNVYAMNCKLIGTNNNTDDQLHFENINRINLGSVNRFGEFFVVYSRDLIQDPAHGGKSTVVITLKHTDYDPLVSALYSPSAQYGEGAKHMSTWSRTAIDGSDQRLQHGTFHVGKRIQLATPSPARGPGGPSGGRVPLSLGRTVRPVASTSSAVPSVTSEIQVIPETEVEPEPNEEEEEAEADSPLADMTNNVYGKRPRRH
ncbi:uncharacterized protein MELLADRAFT_96086 [Melampsora larici-populina 98AG31]|uniref:Uncharacterized protein n=1 Tax=Melampsora larici-populina (strain 98AG31 / pathotype 3-4-7) TaxID=747676 RepID=F4SAX0_MELLP|nr:uncharacterized protein MELLADRAFT_96086 [Melampsora larici-populina 98AG31]EGF98211.1 hypothetical protein MELLADRAFT_96086 [Melampsora larici-populina 98AG31]